MSPSQLIAEDVMRHLMSAHDKLDPKEQDALDIFLTLFITLHVELDEERAKVARLTSKQHTNN